MSFKRRTKIWLLMVFHVCGTGPFDMEASNYIGVIGRMHFRLSRKLDIQHTTTPTVIFYFSTTRL